MDSAEHPETPTRILLFGNDREMDELARQVFPGPDGRVELVFTDDAAALETTPPDLIAAAWDSPRLTGPELLDRMRAAGVFAPVVFTGHIPGDAIPAFRRGAADFLVKPLDGGEFGERIRAALTAWNHPVGPAGSRCSVVLSELAREKKEMNDLLRISASYTISSDSKDILKRLTDLAAESMHCEAASIMLINEREHVLEFVVATGEKGQRLETITVPLGEGIAGWVAVHGEPQIVNDTRTDSRFTGRVDEESGFVTRQILAVPMRLENEIIGVLEVINTRDRRTLGGNDLRLLTGIGERAATVISTVRKIETQQNFYIQTTNILVRAIERKDVYSEGHSWKVAELCHKIAAAMNLSESDRNDLYFGALLHDIGKLDLPPTLFSRQAITEREREMLHQHPLRGAKLLEPITLWKTVVPSVLFHHEAWDGGGYPFGRSGNDIPLLARIINLTEAFTVMRAPHTYKRQLSLKESVLEIMRNAGKQFDPDVVKVFMSVLEKETA